MKGLLDGAYLGQLTRREREIALLVGQGLSSKWIGRSLGISYLTVRKHRQRLYRKLGIQTATQLAALVVTRN